MSLKRARVASSIGLLFFAVVACGQSDYQGGGRRNDLGANTASGIGLGAGGVGHTEDTAGNGGSTASGSAGYAGCALGGEAGEGPFIFGCTP
jgi:hypothetical protein